MKTATISGTPRTGLGKKDTKAVRNQGLVPCVLYGAADQIHFAADSREFKKVLFTPEVFTESVLKQLDENVIRKHFVLPAMGSNDEITNALEAEFEDGQE